METLKSSKAREKIKVAKLYISHYTEENPPRVKIFSNQSKSHFIQDLAFNPSLI